MTIRELERKVLASIFIHPHMLDRFRRAGSWFDDPRHKTILNAMAEARVHYGEIDMITVTTRLELYDNLDYVGGVAYLSELLDSLSSNESPLAVLEAWRERRTR